MAWTTALTSKKLRDILESSLQARQRVSESQERERWRGRDGVRNSLAFSSDASTAEQGG